MAKSRDVPRIVEGDGPSGGYGSLESVARRVLHERTAAGAAALLKQNKPDGFMGLSCAWAKPAEPRAFEFCENGAKATAWEATAKRA